MNSEDKGKWIVVAVMGAAAIYFLGGFESSAVRQAKEATRNYEIAAAGGASKQEQCELASVAAGSWSVAGDEKNAEYWRLMKESSCLSAYACSAIIGCDPRSYID